LILLIMLLIRLILMLLIPIKMILTRLLVISMILHLLIPLVMLLLILCRVHHLGWTRLWRWDPNNINSRKSRASPSPSAN